MKIKDARSIERESAMIRSHQNAYNDVFCLCVSVY